MLKKKKRPARSASTQSVFPNLQIFRPTSSIPLDTTAPKLKALLLAPQTSLDHTLYPFLIFCFGSLPLRLTLTSVVFSSLFLVNCQVWLLRATLLAHSFFLAPGVPPGRAA